MPADDARGAAIPADSLSQMADLAQTPLHDLHLELNARMAPFAGWDMPVSFEGVLAEHAWCRTEAGLFDVSHMAVIELWGDNPAQALELVTPAGITTVAEGRQRYGLLLNDDGGVVDDFIVTNWGGHLTMVANASRRDADLAYLRSKLTDVDIVEKPEIALIAIQGPQAATVVEAMVDANAVGVIKQSVFLDNVMVELGGIQVAVGRSGYTGEDGFEIAVANGDADRLARTLLEHPSVKPIGLGARDTLRLEAGLCLYGNDLDETTSPVEADLMWTIPKRRREAGDFPGAARILNELENGPNRVRVGLQPTGKRPVRPPSELRSLDGANENPTDSKPVGSVCSGGFGPTVDAPVAMAYVAPESAEIGTELVADVRGKDVECQVVDTPFVAHRYRR